MGYLIAAIDQNRHFRERLKTYRFRKSREFHGLRIVFHSEVIKQSLPEHRLVYPVIEVEPYSPAAAKGMENGQRLVAVNEKFVNRTLSTIEEIIAEIELSYNSNQITCLTVINREVWVQCMENPHVAANLVRKKQANSSNNFESCSIRIIRVSQNDSFGFELASSKLNFHFVRNVEPNLPAYRAGLRNNDQVLKVNGENVSDMKHSEVISRICSNSLQIDLFVSSKSKVVQYRINNEPEFDGLGITVVTGGRISMVEKDSPSFRAGLRVGHRIVEVCGENVSNMKTKKVIKLIKENVNDLMIGVIRSEIWSDERYVFLKSRSDFDGFGFCVSASETGPHWVSEIKEGSPSDEAGLRVNELILSVSDKFLVGVSFDKMLDLVMGQSRKGYIKLGVGSRNEI